MSDEPVSDDPEPPDGRRPPSGGEEITAALLDAAADLFAERGYHGVSLREVAATAGVQYSLVHRHVGTKQALLVQVTSQLSAAMAASLEATLAATPAGTTPRVLRVMAQHERFWKIVARAVLDGVPLATLMEDHPVLDVLLARVRTQAVDAEGDPRVRAVAAASAAMGWLAFGDFLAGSLQLEGVDVADDIEQVLRAVVTPGSGPTVG